ncbi:MAG: DUF4872 domain-containing protein [Spirochaetia bacterium]
MKTNANQTQNGSKLKNFQPKTGKHCESSAMLNMLCHQGYDLTETKIIGAGSAMGFWFQDGNFPFLGGRTHRLKENFFSLLGIPWQEEIPEGTNKAGCWKKIGELLTENHPVVLQVDMRYLPYLYNGKYGPPYMSFGWHLICIAGIDHNSENTWVTDTGRGLQEIRMKDLHRARFSKSKIFPPAGKFYWADKIPPGFSTDWNKTAEKSLTIQKEEMTAEDEDSRDNSGLTGLSKLPEKIEELGVRTPAHLLPSLLDYLSDSIETNGTGGSAFRTMYRQFLTETSEQTGSSYLREAAAMLAPAETAWTSLAAQFKAMGQNKQVLRNKEARKRSFRDLADTGAEIFKHEKNFYDYIK